MAKNNSSPIIPPEIKEPGTEGNSTPVVAKKSSIIDTPDPVLSLEELTKQMAEIKANALKAEENEKVRQAEHEAKMKELDEKLAASDKVNFAPLMNKIVNDVPTRAAYEAKARTMKEKLAKEETKTIFIPKPATEPEGIMFHVQLNGFIVEIPKDTYVDVPITVWQTIVDSQKQIAKAGEKYRLDLNGKSPRLEKSIDPVAPSTPEQ